METTALKMEPIAKTNFNFPKQNAVYHGKVRDVYTIADKFLVMIASDRISAFDVVLPRAIPFKGQVLNQLAYKMISATSDILPNWIIDSPDPNVTIGKKCEPFKVENGYLIPPEKPGLGIELNHEALQRFAFSGSEDLAIRQTTLGAA